MLNNVDERKILDDNYENEVHKNKFFVFVDVDKHDLEEWTYHRCPYRKINADGKQWHRMRSEKYRENKRKQKSKYDLVYQYGYIFRKSRFVTVEKNVRRSSEVL